MEKKPKNIASFGSSFFALFGMVAFLIINTFITFGMSDCKVEKWKKRFRMV